MLEDDDEAVQTLAELLTQLVAYPAPPGLRQLSDIATAMLAEVPTAQTSVDEDDRRVLRYCAAAVAELVGDCGDRLLHWDLHYDNVLAGTREPWLAIDPKPLAGDPGFDRCQLCDNRWEQLVATGNVARAVRRRFDHVVDVVGLDRDRALGWTLGRVLQNCLWNIQDGETEIDRVQVAVFEALTSPSTRD